MDLPFLGQTFIILAHGVKGQTQEKKNMIKGCTTLPGEPECHGTSENRPGTVDDEGVAW